MLNRPFGLGRVGSCPFWNSWVGLCLLDIGLGRVGAMYISGVSYSDWYNSHFIEQTPSTRDSQPIRIKFIIQAYLDN